MMTKTRTQRFFLLGFFIVIFIGTVVSAAAMYDLVIAMQGSVEGVVWRGYRIEGEVSRGDYVCWCPDEKFFNEHKFNRYLEKKFLPFERCFGHTPLLKKVAAVAGDHIRCGDAGVFINGVLIRFSQPHFTDDENRPMQIYRNDEVIGPEYLFLMGEHPNSFDSRYFGPIKSAWIKKGVKRVF